MTTRRCVFFQYVICIYMVMLKLSCYCEYSNVYHYDAGNEQALQIITSSSYHESTSIAAIKQDDSEKNNIFINTTESDDVFINKTERENVFNNSLSTSTLANNRNYSLENISKTEYGVSIQGDTSYVNTNPAVLLTSTQNGAIESIDNSVKADNKRRSSTTERRQPLEAFEVHHAIKHGATIFNRQHKYNPRFYQHHLQLMPMDDDPFDSHLFKDHRYVLSVLVPICVVAIGAAMIMATVFSLRYIARRRAVGVFPLTDGSSIENQAQSISRISSERTDRIGLLSVKDDADM